MAEIKEMNEDVKQSMAKGEIEHVNDQKEFFEGSLPEVHFSLDTEFPLRRESDYTQDIKESIEEAENLEADSIKISSSSEFVDRVIDDCLKDPDRFRVVMKINEGGADVQADNMYNKNLSYIDMPDLTNHILYFPEYNIYFGMVGDITDSRKIEKAIFYTDARELYYAVEEGIRLLKNRQTRTYQYITDTSKGITRKHVSLPETDKDPVLTMKENIQTEIEEGIQTFFDADTDFFEKYNVPRKRGILLHGPPGNGKTTLIRRLIATVPVSVISWNITGFTNSESVHEVFQNVVPKVAPCILVIEDIDTMTNKDTRATFLNQLDGITSTDGLFLIGTTNYPDAIDPSLSNRPGRFDRMIEVPLPDTDLRMQYMQRRGFHTFFDEGEIAKIAKETEDFSFVHLNELFISCALSKHNGYKVDQWGIIKRIQDTIDDVTETNFEKPAPKLGF